MKSIYHCQRTKNFWKKQIRYVHEQSNTTNRIIPAYDFQRYRQVFNNNKPLRFPIEDMEVTYFIRPDCHDTDEEILEQQLKQERYPISQIGELLPTHITSGIDPYSSVSDVRTDEATLHGEATFLGFVETHEKLERYIIKFFPNNEAQHKNARREVLFSYLFVEAGEHLHAPKITFMKLANSVCVLRRFYKGMDGRFVIENDIPDEIMKQLRPISLVKYYALRYVLLGDLDFHNPGNIIFTRHSDLTPKVLLHIDGEGIIPDHDSCSQFIDVAYNKDDPIPGSLAWRRSCSSFLGDEEFFNRMCDSSNILLSFLRQQNHSYNELANLELSMPFLEHVLQARGYFESLVKSFDILPVEDLQNGSADFQLTFDQWEACYKQKKPITLFNLVTGLYS